MRHHSAAYAASPQHGTALDAKLVKLLLHTSRDLIIVLDPFSEAMPTFLEANEILCQKLGYSREELLALQPEGIFAGGPAKLLSALREQLGDTGTASGDIALIGRSGEEVLAEFHAHTIKYLGRKAALIAARDISEHQQLEYAWHTLLQDLEAEVSQRTAALMEINRQLQAEIIERTNTQQTLAEKEQQLRLITDNMLDVVTQVDTAGIVRYVSPSCKLMLGHEPAYFLGKSVTADFHPDDVEAAVADFRKVLATGEPLSTQYRLQHADGRWIWAEGIAKRVRDEKGRILGSVVCTRDITGRKRVEQQLKYQAVRDPITGLYNRTYFEIQMNGLTDPVRHPVGLILFDLDGLKYVNDTLGHDAGDYVLASLADLISKCFRDNEIIARIGGDEFAVIMPNADEAAIAEARAEICQAIAAYNGADPKIPLCVSIGAAITGPSLGIQGLFKEADNSMYREKLLSQKSSRSSVVQALKKALEARDFVTEGHASRLRDLTQRVAKVCGFPDYHLTDLLLFAEFHDIGKVGIPDNILFKSGPLTPEEAAIMRTHCEIGHRIAISTPDLEPIAEWILKHHEWWNGGGYPLGLKGTDIPLECRILSIADAYDAMTNDRPYRRALSHAAAIKEIRRCAGVQFDPDLVKRFTSIIYPV